MEAVKVNDKTTLKNPGCNQLLNARDALPSFNLTAPCLLIGAEAGHGASLVPYANFNALRFAYRIHAGC
jgi:hypothetical protein